MAEEVKGGKKISPYMVLFLIHPIQIGVGVLSFQREIIKGAGYDAWISIIIAGFATHLILWLMYGILNKSKGGLIQIHHSILGKWLGGLLSFLFILYLSGLTVLAIRTYVEIVQVWMFRDVGTWLISTMLLFLACYAIFGGFRTVIGISFFGFLVPFFGVVWVFIYPMTMLHFSSLSPIFSHSFMDILGSAKQMTLSYIGIETLFIAYPFIQKPESSQKWAHIANFFSMLVYLFVGVISFAFFSQGQLGKLIWPTLSLVKIVELPWLERFEFFFICLWLLTMLPNVVITLWAASRGAKELFKIKHKYVLAIISVMVFIATLLLKDRSSVNQYNKIVTMFGFYFLYFYIPVLWIFIYSRSKVRKLS